MNRNATVAAEVSGRTAPRAGRALREPALGIALSGGGYRAMLFHVGALMRLHELGLLGAAARISSVSGGSITAAVLATEWSRLGFEAVAASSPLPAVAKRVHRIADSTIDAPSVLGGICLPGVSAAGLLAREYRRHFGAATLQDLPDHPRFTFNTTNFTTGVLMRWAKEYAADYKLGTIFAPDVRLSDVVAASSAFPPYLSPLSMRVRGELVDHDSRMPIADAPNRLFLTDGGVYDNYGLEPLKSFHTVLVSDGGLPFNSKAAARVNWLSQSLRTASILTSQVRAVRARELIHDFTTGARLGTLWTIGTPMSNYPIADALPVDPKLGAKLAAIPTRLKALPTAVQRQLVNWGYAQADAAIRSYVETSYAPPRDWPYPEQALG